MSSKPSQSSCTQHSTDGSGHTNTRGERKIRLVDNAVSCPSCAKIYMSQHASVGAPFVAVLEVNPAVGLAASWVQASLRNEARFSLGCSAHWPVLRVLQGLSNLRCTWSIHLSSPSALPTGRNKCMRREQYVCTQVQGHGTGISTTPH